MLTRVLYVRANCMCKLGCFKHSANEIFNLLHYVLIKPQFKCNWKTISSLYENYVLKKFVVFYLFDFCKVIDHFDNYFNLTMSCGLSNITHSWSWFFWLLILPPPINVFFVRRNNKRERNPFLHTITLHSHPKKSNNLIIRNNCLFTFRKKKILCHLFGFKLVCWGHLRACFFSSVVPLVKEIYHSLTA